MDIKLTMHVRKLVLVDKSVVTVLSVVVVDVVTGVEGISVAVVTLVVVAIVAVISVALVALVAIREAVLLIFVATVGTSIVRSSAMTAKLDK